MNCRKEWHDCQRNKANDRILWATNQLCVFVCEESQYKLLNRVCLLLYTIAVLCESQVDPNILGRSRPRSAGISARSAGIGAGSDEISAVRDQDAAGSRLNPPEVARFRRCAGHVTCSAALSALAPFLPFASLFLTSLSTLSRLR